MDFGRRPLAEKMRVHILAKELNVSSKDILDKCAAEGIILKNHMATLSAGQEATIREWFSEGEHQTTIERSNRVDLTKVRRPRRRKASPEGPADAGDAGEDRSGGDETSVAVADEAPGEAPAEVAKEEVALPAPAPVAEAPAPAEPPAPDQATAEPAPVEMATPPATPAVVEAPREAPPAAPEAPPSAPAAPETPSAGLAAAASAPQVAEPKREPLRPAGPQNVPAPAKLSGPRVVRYEAPDDVAAPRRGPRTRRATLEEQGPPTTAGGPREELGEGRPRGGSPRRRGGPVDERDVGKRAVQRRQARSAAEAGEKLVEWNDQDLAERRERLRGATGRRAVNRRVAARRPPGSAPQTPEPITRAQVEEPITVKQLCSALALPFQKLFPVLHRESKALLTVMSVIPKELAELVALHFGVELVVAEAKTALDRLQEEHQAIERKNLVRRPPIVTILGHVDHGKTSLLDCIRRARVAEKEDGGITQHISSYHFRRDNVAVTFLDTPGHEAFTALRARGAQITDICVLVVAADDGVMPQTVEAINHAKAANVPIVVALNKIDLGTQNVNKIYGQLAERGLTPSGDWGGDIDVVHTSATTGQGVDGLLELLSTLAEVHDYKADPTIPATGTVIEAESRQGAGAVLQVIVKEGTVRVGDILVCGNAYGKVRALHDDTGRAIEAAGPAMPAEIWGLNDAPSAGDLFYQVDSPQRAKEIAEEVGMRRRSDSRLGVRKARSLDDLMKQRTDGDVRELNAIIRADVDGSADVLAHQLEQFPSNEVKLNILHAGIGAVTDSDVQLADASDAIIIAFRVTAPGKTRKLAEEKGVDIRFYKVIYDVVDDIKKALEGLLAPEEVVEQRGVIEVRDVFRISKVGLVAGCYVQEGTVANSHLVRVIRNGAVIRDSCRIESLKRFKDDVKEVRHGMECGVRLEGFEDLKVGDSLEAFEIVRKARTL
jgi:translation initiation factor IF-2